MGFGLLFLGYFFLLTLPVGEIDILPDVIGWIIMASALRGLCGFCPDNRHFSRARTLTLPGAVLSALLLILDFVLLLDVPAFLTTADTVLRLAYSAVMGVYEIFLLLGIYKLAREVELPKLSARAQRMMAVTVVYYLMQIVVYSGIPGLLPESQAALVGAINLAVYALGYLWLILTLALLFTCYMRICLEGDEDMPYREDLFDRVLARFKGKK